MDIARLESLPGLSSEEKGRILAGLLSLDDQKLELLFKVSDDVTLGATLRTMFLHPSVAPSVGGSVAEKLLNVLVEGQSELAKGERILLAEVRTLKQGVSASLWLTLWGDIASTTTSESTMNFRNEDGKEDDSLGFGLEGLVNVEDRKEENSLSFPVV